MNAQYNVSPMFYEIYYLLESEERQQQKLFIHLHLAESKRIGHQS